MFKSEKFNENDLVKIDRNIRNFIKNKKMKTLQGTLSPPIQNSPREGITSPKEQLGTVKVKSQLANITDYNGFDVKPEQYKSTRDPGLSPQHHLKAK